jgi:hypothetical protein
VDIAKKSVAARRSGVHYLYALDVTGPTALLSHRTPQIVPQNRNLP